MNIIKPQEVVYLNYKLNRILVILGQAGRGNSEEFGLLSLEFDENFCMGGPGVIMSRETLRRVAPHIPTCLKNLYSTHEDVEVGRCVQKFAGIPCTWNYEVCIFIYLFSVKKDCFIQVKTSLINIFFLYRCNQFYTTTQVDRTPLLEI